MNDKTQILEQLAAHIGFETLIAHLPQRKVCEALKLVTSSELATSLGITYDELRWKLSTGEIPHPTFRLVRRSYYTQREARQIKSRWKRMK
jgi:hypothetical protein